MTSALPPSPPPPVADQPQSSWPPPPPAGPVHRPPLRRSRSDKVIGGVAGGLAEYTGVDALLWRVGAIALTLAGGTGFILYVLLWLLMPAGPALPAGRPEAPARRSPVPGVTVAALLIVLGVGVLVDQFTDVDLGGRGFLGSALLVVGVGLVVSALTGVGRAAKGGLIGLGIVLSVGLLITPTLRLPDGEWGDRTYRPASASAVASEYVHGGGDMTLDLGDVDVADLDRPITTRIDHGLGDLEVRVPASADVRVTVDLGLGETRLFGEAGDGGDFAGLGPAKWTGEGEPADGGDFAGLGPAEWTGDGEPEIVLVIESVAGDVVVSRG